ncbi:MAG: prolyl 4-hydroxylase [Sphingomonadales bacterium]|nr:prolyl 4-hydroxylase [Sphingomonadales bacterium]
MSNVTDQAQKLLERGDVQAAAMLLKRAERAGDALAARELATWLLEGRVIRRSLAESRAYFERGADLGDERSAAIARAFIAGGVGGPSDWPRAMELLRSAAAQDPAAQTQLALIEKMSLDPSGDTQGTLPSKALSDSPDVRLFPKFFSPDECEFLIASARPALRPSVVVDPYSGREIPNPIRTSSGAGFPFVDENPAIHALNRRIAAASATDVRAGEPMQVLSYAPGQQYREHSDALPNVAPRQQRVITFLVYLDDNYEGGETVFPTLGLKVRGRTGDGLLFRNASGDGEPDLRSLHAGLPVTRGVKHVASRWIRAEPLILE